MSKKLTHLNLALAVLVFLAASLLARDFLVLRYSQPIAMVAEAAAEPLKAKPEMVEFAPIVEKEAFPSPTRTFTEIGLAAEQAADGSTLAGIKLLGTFVGLQKIAVIETPEGKQEVYKEGDRMSGGGVLKEVGDQKAVISTGTREVTITMEVRKPEEVPQLESVEEGMVQASPSKFSRQTGDKQWVIDQKAVISSLDNMGQILSDARLTPRLTKGVVEGFMVTEIKPKGVFDAIGLKNGDVLRRINGYPIDSPEKAVQALSAIKGTTEIDLDIIRSGKQLSLRYSIK